MTTFLLQNKIKVHFHFFIDFCFMVSLTLLIFGFIFVFCWLLTRSWSTQSHVQMTVSSQVTYGNAEYLKQHERAESWHQGIVFQGQRVKTGRWLDNNMDVKERKWKQTQSQNGKIIPHFRRRLKKNTKIVFFLNYYSGMNSHVPGLFNMYFICHKNKKQKNESINILVFFQFDLSI